MIKKALFRWTLVVALFVSNHSYASGWFVGYEFGEMAFNDFKNIAGEVGYTFENKQSLRLSYLNILLSERHLSSSEASAVDGDNVEGLWRGADIYYDFPIKNNYFVSPYVGYYDMKFSHTVLAESVRYKTASAGFAVSYFGDSILGVDELYWRFSLTFGYFFNELDKTTLGETVVNGGSVNFIPQIFVGYDFK